MSATSLTLMRSSRWRLVTAAVAGGTAWHLLSGRAQASSDAARSSDASTGLSPSMFKAPLTLHLYDHCPFCSRVELVFGWRGVAYNRKVYGYGDSLGDPAKGLYSTGVTLTGKKQLPVLELPDGTLQPESSDIIAAVEAELPAPSLKQSADPKLKQFFRGEFKQLMRVLVRPRTVEMTHLTDWERPEDAAYSKQKYTKEGFDYDDAVRRDAEVKPKMETKLKELELLLGDRLSTEHEWDWDDVRYLPELRTLSMVEGLRWPPRLRAYVVRAYAAANAPIYFGWR